MFCAFGISLYAQLINVNLDPKGEPWIAGGFKIPSKEKMAEINNLPELKLSNNQKTTLPTKLDNSTNQYFRPIFNQSGGSCAQASGIAYNFTYEMSLTRNVAANTSANQYPSHFTYNFLNSGDGEIGSTYFEGWDIVRANGCPNIADYGGLFPGGETMWMSGYSKYYNAMHNKCLDFMKITVNTPEGLEVLKNWMHNHLDGSANGGLANFSAGATDYDLNTLPTGTPNAGKDVLTKWGPTVNHAMTFVGYDDEIKYDFNGDGQYTNNLDINSDGTIDMKDWEIGGLIVANSWGTYWGNSGKCYMMYKLLAEPVSNGGIWNNAVYVIKARHTYEPKLTIKTTIKHTSRKALKITAGVSNNTTSTTPDYIMEFPLFNYQGGDYYMQGGYSESDKTIELGLDVTPLLSYINNQQSNRFFLMVNEQDASGSNIGEIVTFSVIDYTNGTNETTCSNTNVSINNNAKTTLYVDKTINYQAASITDNTLPAAIVNQNYDYQLNATGGLAPYKWNIKIDYNEYSHSLTFPNITSNQLQPLSNDDAVVKHALPFSFPFYGKYYDTVYVSTDGSLLFDKDFQYVRSESAIKGNKVITVFGFDLMIYPDQNDGIFYSGDATHATFRWKTSLFEQPDANIDATITIYPNGEIAFNYGNDLTQGLDWATGISNGDMQNFKIGNISNSTNIPNDYKYKFTGNEFPKGMELTSDGHLQGTPTESNKTYPIKFMLTDYNNITTLKTLDFTTISTGINNKNSSDVNIYPNPIVDKLQLNSLFFKNEIININIYSIEGNLIYQSDFYSNNEGIEIDCKSFNTGVYFIKINTNKEQIVRKIIKE